MSTPLFERVAIIGLGQMGASLALSIKAGGRVGTIAGFDTNPDHSSTALSIEAIDVLSATPEEVVEDADLVVLCTPVGAYGPITQTIAPHIKQGATLTDIGSIKSQAIADIVEHLPEHVKFVPSHPIAGSEMVGPYTSRSDYFKDHLFLITPLEQTQPDAVVTIGELWESTGAHIGTLPAEAHDFIYAYMSHMPQFMCFAAMPVLDIHDIRLEDDDVLFKRFIRIGRSDPEMWRDVFIENATNTIAAAESVQSILAHMAQELQSGLEHAKQEAPSGEDKVKLMKSAWPRMLGSALIMAVSMAEQQTEQKLARYAAGGFTDFTSVASEEPDGDMSVISDYAPVVLDMLESYLETFGQIIDYLKTQDKEHLLAQLAVYQACGKRVISVMT